MVQSGKNWRGDDRSAPLDSSLTAHPSPTPSACATRCNKTNMKPAFAADAARRRSEHDPGTHAEAFRSGVQRMGSATATSVIWVGHESPSLEFGAERPARRHDHCRAPNRWAPCSTGMPLPSVESATPPTGCGSPQTTAVAAVHGRQQERQTAARRSRLEPRTDRSPQLRPHGCAGMSASSAMAVHGGCE